MSRSSPSGPESVVDFEVPRHVAVIMDGNGRWARKRLLPRIEGHRAGAKTLRAVVEESRRIGVRYLTVFAFSTENWQRPKDEVGALMKLLEHHLRSEIRELCSNGVRLRAIGELSALSDRLRGILHEAEQESAHCRDLDLLLALSYGGRRELVHAAQQLAQRVREGTLRPEEIDEACVSGALYAPDVPDPDVLIRTSGECRISNFLLWQLAYAEIVITPTLWPELGKSEYVSCLREYSRRVRRYGLTDEQLVKAGEEG